ncbi:NADPH-dependent FMN reductase [Amycolatopsis sp. ATCC 39116]|uniref:NADPH-dependent FMN reductase n=1 Tax=Amycolatopsis sp. (strain ATCC 39116 / 75iv2) TaxID=385957 RepID=UPI00036465B0|nr:NAD(P)H-dependent oxidoreductase [Amycolatopsis sp. ATCC 39116]
MTHDAKPVRVLGISGSLRAASHSTTLLRGLRTPPGAELDLWTGLADVQPFNEDHEAEPGPGVLALREAIAGADALLIATPEYNSSLPGQLKNALDWASRPYGEGVLVGKPVAVAGVSPSDYGAEWSQAELRQVLSAIGAQVVERRLCVPRADNAFDPDGALRDADLRATLAALLDDLAAATRGALTGAGRS